MELDTATVDAVLDLLDGLELYGRREQLEARLRAFDFNGALAVLSLVQRDNAPIATHTASEYLGNVRRNAYQLAQTEARIAEYAYKARKAYRMRLVRQHLAGVHVSTGSHSAR